MVIVSKMLKKIVENTIKFQTSLFLVSLQSLVIPIFRGTQISTLTMEPKVRFITLPPAAPATYD